MGRGGPPGRYAGRAALPLLLLAGCLAPAPPPEAEEEPTAAPTKERPRPEAARIVSLAPSLTTVVIAVGLGDNLVAVDSYSWGVPDSLPRVGGLFDPDVEALLRLKPTLIIGLPSHAGLRERLAGLDTEWLLLPSETLGDLRGATTALAALAPPAEEDLWRQILGTLWSGKIRARGARIEACLPEAVAECAPQRVLIVIGRKPGTLQGMMVAGPEVFPAELVRGLEAATVPAASVALWPQIGAEEVLRLAPDQIWEMGAAVPGQDLCCAAGSRFAPYLALAGVPAVESRAFVLFDDPRMLVPGTNVLDILAAFQEALWPGLPHPSAPLTAAERERALTRSGDG